ncbi:GNAT family N-acetyltransferase [Paenibacillus agricola]|uniref:GNAT family N-acetyltransferase n=1 Tax=Paenibacillus agricola TaxID=2716264 RepID=A0ABX0J4Z5_9BACL|nr:GNAT family N-acetyltransferase [Paenibacillus agricola]NHN31462.1 GNAT family N-acetyltransferase [Paenibacillus agricola]
MNLSINLYERPNRFGDPITQKINQLINSLTGIWFTEDVAAETCKDLMFQDLLCAESDGQVTSFLVFTCSEGSISISLMGTDPRYHRKGIGSKLLLHLFEHVKKMGFNKIVVLTVPPSSKPLYQQTVQFYEKHGFKIEKEFTELWQSGTVQLVKILD